MIQAVIYDMDGLIIDSEPLWGEAEIAALASVGVSLTTEMTWETQGLRVDEVIQYWSARFPIPAEAAPQLEAMIWEQILRLVAERGVAKTGVLESLAFFKSTGVKLGLASTSKMILINAVLDKLGIRDYFEQLHSAEFEEYGKPHPGVYITEAKKLGVMPAACLALEDSINGVLAAKSAKMKCIAVPEHPDDRRLQIADAVIPTLLDVNEALWTTLNSKSS